MNQFTPETVADWIGLALVAGVLIRICWMAFISYCDSTPIYDPLVSGPKDLPPTLRQPLPEARNMTGAAKALYSSKRYATAVESEGGEA